MKYIYIIETETTEGNTVECFSSKKKVLDFQNRILESEAVADINVIYGKNGFSINNKDGDWLLGYVYYKKLLL